MSARQISIPAVAVGAELPRAFAVQARVVQSLILREIRTRFGKNKLGYLWAIMEPFMHMLVWWTFHMLVSQPLIDGIDMILFLTTGLVPLFLFLHVQKFVTYAVTANQALLQYPLVKHVDLMIARFVLESCTEVVVSVVTFGALIAAGMAQLPDDTFWLLMDMFALAALGFGFGSFNSVMIILSPTYEKSVQVLNRVLYFSAGIFFSFNNLPLTAVKWLSLNPICHGVSLFRAAYIHGYLIAFGSLWYIWLWAGCFMLLALIIERLFRGKIQAE